MNVLEIYSKKEVEDDSVLGKEEEEEEMMIVRSERGQRIKDRQRKIVFV